MIGTALTWAVGWAGVTVALNLLGGVPLRFIGLIALGGLVQGFIAGGGFALILSIAERRHTLEELSLRRVAIWGGLGGGLLFLPALPLLLSAGIPVIGILMPLAIDGLIGASFASGSVALARRVDGPRLTEAGAPP